MYGTLIQTVTVGAGGAASIDFTSIPGTYTDLCLVISGRTTFGLVYDKFYYTINGSTANITDRFLYGDGSSAASSSYGAGNNQAGFTVGASATANTFGNAMIYFPNYAGSTYKSFSVDSVGENNATAARMAIDAVLWSSTAAITSISISNNGSWVQYTTASLYGITKDSGGATVS